MINVRGHVDHDVPEIEAFSIANRATKIARLEIEKYNQLDIFLNESVLLWHAGSFFLSGGTYDRKSRIGWRNPGRQ